MKLVLERRPAGLLVSRACALVGLARSTYYACLKRAPARRPLDAHVARVCRELPFYGFRRVAHQLRWEGVQAGFKAVRSSMKRLGLCARKRPRRRRATSPVPVEAQNLLAAAPPAGPRRVLAADATWIPMSGGRGIYMAVVLDLFTRQALGWSLGRSLDTRLTAAALARAVRRGPPGPGWIHHSDRGSIYASREYRACVSAASGQSSFTAPGSPQQNGAVESFFKTLKHEDLLRRDYDDAGQVIQAVESFIRFYNGQRLHSSLGYKAPDQFAEAIHSQS